MMTDRPCRLLVIEDETPIRRFLRVVLEGAGHVMDEAARGREGIERAATGAPDVVLLDLGLPDIDGKEVIRAIREWSAVPILVVSVRTAETEIIAALDAGADDYVTKPFATGELLARLRVLARRRPAEPTSALVTVGALMLDRAGRAASLRGEALALTRKEFDVLALLAANTGRLITHDQIMTTVWGPAHREDIHYLRVVIGHLRAKLGDSATDPTFIQNEPGIGYRMREAGASDPLV